MRGTRFVLISLALCLALLLLAVPVNAEKKAPAPEGKTPPSKSMQQEGWRCPMGGASRGPGECPAMMSQQPGYHGGWYMAPNRQRGGTEHYKTPLSKEQARMIMENYLRETNNPNLKVGKITEEPDFWVARIETKNGSLVDKVQIHKMTGWIRSEYSAPPETPKKNTN